jgi:flagellar hook-basal body complex protein FliE
MTINPVDVAKAYSNVAKSAGFSGDAGSSGKVDGLSFGDFLKDQINSVRDTGQESERLAVASLSGKADLVDVVTAISAAEITLETVVAVRNKVITAYNDIMRMPI